MISTNIFCSCHIAWCLLASRVLFGLPHSNLLLSLRRALYCSNSPICDIKTGTSSYSQGCRRSRFKSSKLPVMLFKSQVNACFRPSSSGFIRAVNNMTNMDVSYGISSHTEQHGSAPNCKFIYPNAGTWSTFPIVHSFVGDTSTKPTHTVHEQARRRDCV